MVRCNVCGATYNDVGLCSAFGILHGRGDANDDWLADFLSRPRSPSGFEDQESDKQEIDEMVDEKEFEDLCMRVDNLVDHVAKLTYKVKELDDTSARAWRPGTVMETRESMGDLLENPLLLRERENRCMACRPCCPTCLEVLASPGYQTCTCFTCPDCGRVNTELMTHTCGKEPSVKSSLAGPPKFDFPVVPAARVPDIKRIRADREKAESDKLSEEKKKPGE